MCLKVDLEKTTAAKQNKKGFVYRYKAVRTRFGDGKIVSIYQYHPFEIGLNTSSRSSTVLRKHERQNLRLGFHVGVTKRGISRHDECNYIIKVKCYRKDLVAVGNFDSSRSRSRPIEEVYTKIYIESFNKV